MRARWTLVLLTAVCLQTAAVAACSTAPETPARQRFTEQLQQPGPHRFDQVSVGNGTDPLDPARAACVADAFEKNKWPLESALEGKVPTRVDVKLVSSAVTACLKDPGTTTIGPFGRQRGPVPRSG